MDANSFGQGMAVQQAHQRRAMAASNARIAELERTVATYEQQIREYEAVLRSLRSKMKESENTVSMQSYILGSLIGNVADGEGMSPREIFNKFNDNLPSFLSNKDFNTSNVSEWCEYLKQFINNYLDKRLGATESKAPPSPKR